MEQSSGSHLKPESSLPSSKEEMKSALLGLAVFYHVRGELPPEYRAWLRDGYALLANFVPDNLAEHALRMYRATEAGVKAQGSEELSVALASFKQSFDALREVETGAEIRQLAVEFDERLDAMLLLAEEPSTA
jgi:hypothetical protein